MFILSIEFTLKDGRRALCEKMSFKICGVKPNAIRLKDGRLLNEYSMVRKVER